MACIVILWKIYEILILFKYYFNESEIYTQYDDFVKINFHILPYHTERGEYNDNFLSL